MLLKENKQFQEHITNQIIGNLLSKFLKEINNTDGEK